MVRVPVARILVIDDDPEVVDTLVTHLREEGYGVSGALTSDEGLKLVMLSRPDLGLARCAVTRRNERDQSAQAHPLDQSDRQGDHGHRGIRAPCSRARR